MAIKHSPETPMPPPYDAYVKERADNVAQTLEPIVGDTNVQLCPRVITRDERVFLDGIVYGGEAEDLRVGYKSSLYYPGSANEGVHATTHEQAVAYTQMLLDQGEEVRFKQPEESDGNGQFRITTLDELQQYIDAYPHFAENGIVLMPQYDPHSPIERYSMGIADLDEYGSYVYIGREDIGEYGGRETFLGSTIAVARTADQSRLLERVDQLGIPPHVIKTGFAALRAVKRQMKNVGRMSVDVVEAYTTNGRREVFVPDVTIRVGGNEGPFVDSIYALQDPAARVVTATGRLVYDPALHSTVTGKRYINTPTLVMASTVEDVTGVAS